MIKVKKSKFALLVLLTAVIVLAYVLMTVIPGMSSVLKNDAKDLLESNVEELMEAINQKQLSDDNFNPTTINNSNVTSLLNIPNSNYSSITIILRNNVPYVNIVGKGELVGLVACGSYDDIKVTTSKLGECNEDLTPPSITVLGDNPLDISVGKKYVDPGATSIDDTDGDLTGKILANNNVDYTIPGTYNVTYSVTDNAGNEVNSSRTVNVVDKTAPIVSFSTNSNTTYSQTGSTTVIVSDNYSNVDLRSLKYLWTTSRAIPSTVSFIKSFSNGEIINTPSDVTGEYYLWVLAKDTVDNTTITRTNVFNLDNTEPVITLIGSSNIVVNLGTSYIDAGATATDNINKSVTVTIFGIVNVNVIGTYTLTYNAIDSSGNVATTVVRTVSVVDATIPTVAFGTNGDNTYAKAESTTVTVSDTYSGVNSSSLKYLWNTSTTAPTEANFSVSFTNGDVINTPTEVSGEYYLWVLAKDNSGNTTITRTNVFNLDNEKPVIALTGSSSIDIDRGSVYSDLGATVTDNIDNALSVTATGTINPTVIGTYTITYNVTDNAGNAAISVTRMVNVTDINYVATEGINKPKLAAGMTPIKWDGSTWIDTAESDATWYNYTTVDKQWANARTEDGSMWVWIPRYIYKINTANWHTSTAGTIDIQFTKGTDDNWNKTSIGNFALDESASASKNTWTNHPTFTFGDTELTGFWFAKFEASGTTTAVDFKPNVTSLRNLTVGTMFDISRDMETNSRYGWGTTGNGIDSHMIKNIEWGSVVYLAQSIYGKNADILMNNSSTSTTGCAANSVYDSSYGGCQNTYNTTNGLQASTTGNIYGIYDMSGGAIEYTSSYVDNGDSNLATNGNSIIQASSKYKDVYTMGETDTNANNYALAINKKGDAIYETSANGADSLSSWYGDFSFMLKVNQPWFSRSGFYINGSNSGTFYFSRTSGGVSNLSGFRAVIAVDENL